MNSVKCPDCSAPMEEGFIYDQGAPAHPQSSWVKGPPEPSVLVWTQGKATGEGNHVPL